MEFDKTRAAGVLGGDLARLYTADLQRRLAPLGLSAAQFLVLAELWGQDGQTQRMLTASLGVEQATMANTLARMERDGLVMRRPHPEDKRSQIVELTEAARGIEAQAVTAALAVNRAVLDGLPPPERELFLSMLGRVVAAMRQRDGKPVA